MTARPHRFCLLLIFWISVCGAIIVVPLHAAKPVPELTGRVMDLASMMSPASRSALNGKLIEHENKTGNQIVVLTIPSLEGEVLEDFSLKVARTWALGQKDRNNGVLFLIAKNDRKMRIETGYGVEGTLTDAISGFIIRATVRPLFKQGLYDGGIVAGTGQIIEVLEADTAHLKEWKKRSEKNENGGGPDWGLIVFLAIFSMVFAVVIARDFFIRTFGREVITGHYRWLGMDAGPNAPKPVFGHHDAGGVGGYLNGPGGGMGGGMGGGGFSGGGGGFGGGGASGGW